MEQTLFQLNMRLSSVESQKVHDQNQQVASSQNQPRSSHVELQSPKHQAVSDKMITSEVDNLELRSSSKQLEMMDQTVPGAQEQQELFHQIRNSNDRAVFDTTSLPIIALNHQNDNALSSDEEQSQIDNRRVFNVTNNLNAANIQVRNNDISSKIDISKKVLNSNEMIIESDSLSEEITLKKQEQINDKEAVIDSFAENYPIYDIYSGQVVNSENQIVSQVRSDAQIPIEDLNLNSIQEQFYEKYKKYDPMSLYIFSLKWRFRQIFIDVLSSKYFEYIVVLSIIGNSIVLSLVDYNDEENLTAWNQKLEFADRIFTFIYLVEAAVKIVAFGFIIHMKSYLRDSWNIIDFVVVVIGIISLIPNLLNLKSLRILRIFRPLRSINAVPSIKRLANTLLMTIPQMSYLVSFLLFFIAIFAILGNQLFSRVIYRRCRLTDEPITNSHGIISWPIDLIQIRPCGGYYICQNGTYCHGLIEKQLPLDLDNISDWDYIQNGYFQFDNLGSAIMAIFRVITLEGWTYFMYLYMDCFGFIAGIYFPVLIVMGSFFFLNLFLAVITQTFSEMVKVQQQQEELQLNRLNNKNKQKEGYSVPIGYSIDARKIFLLESKEDQKIEEKDLALIQEDEKQMKSQQSKQSENALDDKGEFFENQVSVIDNKVNSPRIFLQKICNSLIFALIINASIILNTICLGLDQFPVNIHLSSVLNKFNIGFFVIFFLEMIIKITGLGPNTYIKDSFNIFDAIIVTLSIIDIFLSSTYHDDLKMGKGAISVFRAFRLLRIFKLAKSWKQLNKLIQTIAKSLKDISVFSILLFLLIFIYVLIGMQLFVEKNIDLGRLNFKNFFNGFVLVFTVLTGENWDQTMFIFVKNFGAVAIIYFFSLVIVGQMIFMNVFQAILLENFQNSDKEDVEDTNNDQGEEYLSEVISNFFSNKLKRIKDIILSKFSQQLLSKSESKDITAMISIDHSQQFNYQNDDQMYSVNHAGLFTARQLTQKPSQQFNEVASNKNKEILHDETIISKDQRYKRLHELKQFDQQTYFQELSLNKKNSLLDSNSNIVKMKDKNNQVQTQRELVKDNKTLILSNICDTKNMSILPIDKTVKISPLIQQNQNPSLIETTLDVSCYDLMINRIEFQNNHQIQRDNTIQAAGDSLKVKDSLFQRQLYESSSNILLQKSKTQADLFDMPNIKRIESIEISKNNFENSKKNLMNNQLDLNQSIDKTNRFSRENPQSINQIGIKKQQSKSIALILHQKQIDRLSIETNFFKKNINECEGNSLYFLGPRNKFRCYVDQFVKNEYFDQFILMLIIFSSLNLALDNPLNNPNSSLTDYLLLSNYILTSCFIFESLLKIISQGFLLNGDGAFMKSGWNVIDFIVVVISVVSITVTGNKFKFVKIFRLLRILRPLRVISKNKGLRIGIQAFIVAVPRLFNVTIISLLFFIIFGIICVNYFKGTFYNCIFGPQFQDDIKIIPSTFVGTKYDCLNFGGTWINADQNFDNLPQAISTLFQMSTTEGWIDVMNRGIDAVGPEIQPIQDYNIYWSLFFMVFIFFGNFIILNLFTSVVCDTYNSEKEIQGKTYLLSKNQKKWLEYKKICISLTPKIQLNQADSGEFKISIRRLVMSKYFEQFILSCIILNTVTLCINWYSQSDRVDNLLDQINYGFAGIFLIEALLKLAAFGFRAYFSVTDNIFDLVIVLSSIISTILTLMINIPLGSSTTFIRGLRIIRILKIIKQAKRMRVIIDTLIITLPDIINIGGLLLLILYMFSILGIFLFAEVKLQKSLDDHANFQSFGIAFLTLLRCSTGEAWNSIMQDAMRQKSILFQCSEDEFNYNTYVANGFKTHGCGSPGTGIIFFISYFLLIPLFFLDIFVAIIIQGFEQSTNKAKNLIQEEDYENFKNCWVKFDHNGTGFISIENFSQVMFLIDEPLGWGPEYYNNQKLQIDFLEELNIPTYNNFKDFQFYDVLQALIKVYLVNIDPNQEDNQINDYQGLEQIPAEEAQESQRFKNELKQQKREQASPTNPQGPHRKLFKWNRNISNQEKVKRRIELEFEELHYDKKDIMEVEEIRKKYESLMRNYQSKKDQSYTSAHIKAGQKILEALRKLRQKKFNWKRNQFNQDAKETIQIESENIVFKDPKIIGYIKQNREIEHQKGLKLKKYQINQRMQPIVEETKEQKIKMINEVLKSNQLNQIEELVESVTKQNENINQIFSPISN